MKSEHLKENNVLLRESFSDVIWLSDCPFLFLSLELPFGENFSQEILFEYLNELRLPTTFYECRVAFWIMHTEEKRTGMSWRVAVWWSPASLDSDYFLIEVPSKKKSTVLPQSLFPLLSFCLKNLTYTGVLHYASNKEGNPQRCVALISSGEVIAYHEEPADGAPVVLERAKQLYRQYHLEALGVGAGVLEHCREADSVQSLEKNKSEWSELKFSYPVGLNFLSGVEREILFTRRFHRQTLRWALWALLAFTLVFCGIEGFFLYQKMQNEDQLQHQPELVAFEERQRRFQEDLETYLLESNQWRNLKAHYIHWPRAMSAVGHWAEKRARWVQVRALENRSLQLRFVASSWKVLEEMEAELESLRKDSGAQTLFIQGRKQVKDDQVQFVLEVNL